MNHTDPTTLEPCAVCKGTGVIKGVVCPIPPDTDPQCNECQYSGNCADDDETCQHCEGEGWQGEETRKSILKTFEI